MDSFFDENPEFDNSGTNVEPLNLGWIRGKKNGRFILGSDCANSKMYIMPAGAAFGSTCGSNICGCVKTRTTCCDIPNHNFSAPK